MLKGISPKQNSSSKLLKTSIKHGFKYGFQSIFLCNKLLSLLYVTVCFFYSDSVEREDTFGDNSVQLQSFVQYEPELFVIRYACTTIRFISYFKEYCIDVFFNPVFLYSESNLNRYEVHPTRTASEAIGPEFYTQLKVWLTCINNIVDLKKTR